MAKNIPAYDHIVEDDYIDMDIIFSPPHSREFEFQMSINLLEKETTTSPSPADELFYKGKLLPLHLPPRLQMVQKLLQTPTNSYENNSDPLQETLTTTESSKNLAANSCHVSGELNPEEYTDQSQPKKSWPKKLKLIKQSSISLKLKASRAYLKSLFTKSGFSSSDESSNTAPKAEEEEEKNTLEKFQNVTSLLRSIEREKKLIEEESLHRKSFSGAINCHLINRSSPTISSCSSSSSSSFSSVNSNRFVESQILNRSSSVNSEMESSIQGAIAYCKKSQVTARKSVSDVEFCSLSASRIVAACERKERPGLCRG